MRFIFITLVLFPIICSATISKIDSLSVQAVVSGQLFQRTGDVSKATESGYAELHWLHQFDSTGTWVAFTGLEAQRQLGSGLLREAWIGRNFEYSQLQAGYVQEKQGTLLWIDQHNPLSKFYRTAYLWENWGAGLRFVRNASPTVDHSLGIDLSAAVNGRESGFAQMQTSYEYSHAKMALTAGAITVDGDENDNLLRIGTEGLVYLGPLNLHGIARYTKFLGWDHVHNVTMQPGWERNCIIESKFMMGRLAELRAVAEYLRYQKRYSHKEQHITGEWLLFPYSTWKPGARLEWSNIDAERSWFPQAILEAGFVRNSFGVRLSSGIRDFGTSADTKEIQGAVWYAF